MRIKVFIASLLITIVSFPSMAQQEAKPAEVTDSLSIATAIMWHQSFTELYQNDSVKADSLFQGMRDALTMFDSESMYAIGFLEGYQLMMRCYNMRQDNVFINPFEIINTLNDLAHGKSVGMDRNGAEKYITEYFNSAQNETPDTVSIESQEAFLNEQLKRSGVTKTESGLLFEVLKDGYGISPTSGNKVVIKYTGRLADGTIFDQTGEESVTFSVDNLVPGFTEALKMMKAGGKYRIFIPAHLGYGSQNVQGVIPGNSVLDFTIELISVIIE